ncbi:MAG: DUF192 domain-containing protein [Deltaproteobacteria bacterium]|nr:DUF192 domain-containing protein [Deltaproteobacteria bacterium]
MQPRLALLAALVAALPALGACRERRAAVALHPRDGEPVRVFVEVADTPDGQARGLMYRHRLDPDHGMLFVFAEERPHAFWMKNTSIPLDLIFIGSDGRIAGIHADAEPFSLAPIDVRASSRAVLEVNAGFAAAHRLAVGDRVAYHDVASTKPP